MSENQRRHYRLTYPTKERPTLHLANQNYEVLQIAESSIVISTEQASLKAEYIFQGEIAFNDGTSDSVAGAVLKNDAQQAIISLTETLSFKRLMSEQRRIRVTYPAFDFSD
jgi:hypothetical protein